jgi:hypothetical protein
VVIAMIYKRIISKQAWISKQTNDLERRRRRGGSRQRVRDFEASLPGGKRASKSPWPDFSALDLANDADVCSAHALLHDDHPGLDLWIVCVCAAIAVRKARGKPQALFVKLLRDGWGKYTPADCDLATAKRTMQEID